MAIRNRKPKITPQMRKDYIDKYCVVGLSHPSWSKTGNLFIIYSNDEKQCYLATYTDMENAYADKDNDKFNIIDFLISHDINHIEPYRDSDNQKYLPACIGFSEKNQKWFGWTHRAWVEYTIGSSVKKGQAAYKPVDKEEYENNMLEILTGGGSHIDNAHIEHRTDGCFDIVGTYSANHPNKNYRGTEYRTKCGYLMRGFGKGEWTAKTMEDAKEMALDFIEGMRL